MDTQSLARFNAIHFVVTKYAPVKMGKWEKIKVARSYLDLPADKLAIQCLAVASHESQFVSAATSNVGAIGIPQFMPKTALPYLKILGYDPRDEQEVISLLRNPEISIPCQYKHLADLNLLAKGNYRQMLYGYNHSWGYVDTVETRTKLVFHLYDSVYTAGLNQ
jgi:hypothetical protein